MKRRYRYLLNIFSITLLLVALYLNFVKKEANDFRSPVIDGNTVPSTDPATKELKISSIKQAAHTIVLK
jgi:hypothetical protein